MKFKRFEISRVKTLLFHEILMNLFDDTELEGDDAEARVGALLPGLLGWAPVCPVKFRRGRKGIESCNVWRSQMMIKEKLWEELKQEIDKSMEAHSEVKQQSGP